MPALDTNATPPPDEPLEKVVYKQGDWHHEYLNFGGQENLIVGYQGSRTIERPEGQPAAEAADWTAVADFKLKRDTLLRGIVVPYTFPANQVPAEGAKLILKDENDNIFGPYSFDAVKVVRAKEVYQVQKQAQEEGVAVRMEESASAAEAAAFLELDNVFVADSQIVLKKGKYSLFVTNGSGAVRNMLNDYEVPVLVKGIDHAAWQKYRIQYLEWENAQPIETYGGPEGDRTASPEIRDGTIAISVKGSETLIGADRSPEKEYTDTFMASDALFPAKITLKESSVIEEIAFNTLNGGKGAAPGIISILNEKGEVVGKFQASGSTLSGVPNAMWKAGPGIVLPAGEFTADCSDPAVVGYLKDGTPDFYVKVAPAPPIPFDFTGRYYIDASVIKTSTLMGPVSGGAPAFSLNSFELTVLDQGEKIQLIGKYEGMPFSQVCAVTVREQNKVEALFDFAADLTKLPYKAKIGASCMVVITNTGGMDPVIELKGTGTYERKASKTKGADYNTYDVTAKGSQADTVIPAYVAAALGARTPGAGNIPGPANSGQAAAGALFPPLVGLVVQVIQSLIKKKEQEEAGPKHILSVGEQAMADANNSLGKGLYDEKEAAAWAALGAALGNSDEPDDDPESVGDNEKPGGDDYQGVQQGSQSGSESGSGDTESGSGDTESGSGDTESGYGGSGPETGDDDSSSSEPAQSGEAETSSQPGDGNEQQAGNENRQPVNETQLQGGEAQPGGETQQQGGEAQPGGEIQSPQIMTVQVDHTGRTAEIQYDATRGTWVNTESGNDFDMERYVRDVAPSFGKDKEFIETQRHKLETGDTANDRELDRIRKERDEKLAQIQKEADDRKRADIQKEMADAAAAGSYGSMSVINQTLKNIYNDFAEAGKTIKDGASRAADEISEAGKEVWKDPQILVNTFTGTTKEIKDGLANAGAYVADGVSQAVKDIYKNPEILVDTLKGSASTVKDATVKVGTEVVNTVTDPKKAWDFVSDTTGLKNFSNALDPNRTLIDRVTQVAAGTLKLGGTILTAGELTTAAKSGAGKLGGYLDDVLGAGGTKAVAADAGEYGQYMAGVKNQAASIESKIRTAAPNRPLTPEDVKKALSTDEIRQVLRDPAVSRQLKNTHPGVQQAYKDALDSKLYEPSYKSTAEKLQKDMLGDVQQKYGPNAAIEKVEIDTIRTPGSKSIMNADNDLSGKVTIVDGNGNRIVQEIPSSKVAPAYNKNFAENAGMFKDGKFDAAKAAQEMPEGITVTDAKGQTKVIKWEDATEPQQLEAFAKKHFQEVTDVRSAEAAVDFNKTINADNISNVQRVKSAAEGAKLADPGGLAQMETYKIKNAFNQGGIINQTEAYEQLSKMGNLTNDLTAGYQKLGYPVENMSPSMQRALTIASDRSLSPGTRTLELQKLGFDGPGDLANKLSGRIEGMQKLGSSTKGGNMLNEAAAKAFETYVDKKDQ